ncbi:hypothetical protein KAT92_01175 [Candidatus Babeliales bacterium]|nr:hypothetical protein [Candidatus Babeliales bacterium]
MKKAILLATAILAFGAIGSSEAKRIAGTVTEKITVMVENKTYKKQTIEVILNWQTGTTSPQSETLGIIQASASKKPQQTFALPKRFSDAKSKAETTITNANLRYPLKRQSKGGSTRFSYGINFKINNEPLMRSQGMYESFGPDYGQMPAIPIIFNITIEKNIITVQTIEPTSRRVYINYLRVN